MVRLINPAKHVRQEVGKHAIGSRRTREYTFCVWVMPLVIQLLKSIGSSSPGD